MYVIPTVTPVLYLCTLHIHLRHKAIGSVHLSAQKSPDVEI